MNGMEMLVKSMLGIDPAEFKAKLEEGMTLLKNTLTHFDQRITETHETMKQFDDRLKIVEESQIKILEMLGEISTQGKRTASHGKAQINGSGKRSN